MLEKIFKRKPSNKSLNLPELRPLPDEAYEGLYVHQVAKAFGDKVVVRDVSFHVRQGEAVGILGPNGAGKTTCFYMVCGLIHANQGIVTLHGKNISRMPMYRRARAGIGYLPQEMSIFRGMTVEDNIMAVLEVSVKDKGKRELQLEQLLNDFSIEPLRKSQALSLSGGERRRVEIARALAANPDFILLDEPFAGVDPIAVGDIRGLVQTLKRRGIGVLITDHNVRETLDIVDRAYVIFEGHVLASGTAQDIMNNDKVKEVYLGDSFEL